jgi:hypothetical protein
VNSKDINVGGLSRITNICSFGSSAAESTEFADIYGFPVDDNSIAMRLDRLV